MARTFPNSTDLIEGTTFGLPSTTTGSVSIWVKPLFSNNDGNAHEMWGFGSSFGRTPLFIKDSDNTISIQWQSDGTPIHFGTDALMVTNVWANWVFTWNNSTGSVAYKNGTSVGTSAGTTFTASGGGGYVIGNLEVFNRQSDSYLSDFAYWNVTLTPGEAKALASGVRPNTIRPSSLVIWLPIDGLQSPEPDLSGNAYNGTVTATSLAPGPPVTLFTPRAPMFTVAAAGFTAKYRKSLSPIGTRIGSRQTQMWG